MFAVVWTISGCADADLYTHMGLEITGPDRVALVGRLCSEDTSGDRFPVRVLFLIDTSLMVFSADADGMRFTGPRGGLQTLLTRYSNQRHVAFGFVGVDEVAKAVPGNDSQRFFHPRDPEIAEALAALQSPTGQGSQRDIAGAISQAESFIAADMARASPGAILRTRYLVVMLMAGPHKGADTHATLVENVENLREFVYEQGALQFRLNTNLLYYGPRTIDRGVDNYECFEPAEGEICNCGGEVSSQYCAVACDVEAGIIDEERNQQARELYAAMAFAGNGHLREFACPPAIDLSAGIATSSVRLVKKEIIAFNRNVRLDAESAVLDSDGDGLADLEELRASPATDPTRWDSDGDGLSDKLEFRTYPRQDPLDPSDRPLSCLDPATLVVLPDRDMDLLTDCEEGLLQTSPTIPDTDGDGLPDLLEFLAGTVPTTAEDRLMDFDNDGVPNAEEVLAHTNPRSFDGGARGTLGYRNAVVPLGIRQVASMADPEALPGVAFYDAAPNVVGGQGYLRYDACNPTLAWSDARMTAAPPFQPVPTPLDEGNGIYRLYARATNAEETWVDVQVTLALLPSCQQSAEVVTRPLISVSERSCYDVRISNIKLLETLPNEREPLGGINSILVFFTQAPQGRLASPGISKVAEVRVRFACLDSEDLATCQRNPPAAQLEMVDSQFVSMTF